MRRIIPLILCGVSTLLAQYKVDSAGPPPSELAPAVSAVLAKEGVKVLKEDGSVLAEFWLVTALPKGPGPAPANASFTSVPSGAFLGVARFPARHYDRRGQTLRPGIYTLRFGLFPQNGDHMGVAPQRDFLILSPAATDTDPAALPAFDPLMNMSRKASLTPHPLCLSFWKAEAGAADGFEMGEHDGTLTMKLAGTPIAIILIGRHEG
jgi:hypothetical protein